MSFVASVASNQTDALHKGALWRVGQRHQLRLG